MRRTQLLRIDDNLCLAAHLQIADTHWLRLRGLLGKQALSQDEAMLFSPGGGIHTLGMRFVIDVLFLDAQQRVLTVASQVPPQRLCLAPNGTCYTVEFAAGLLTLYGVSQGQQLGWPT